MCCSQVCSFFEIIALCLFSRLNGPGSSRFRSRTCVAHIKAVFYEISDPCAADDAFGVDAESEVIGQIAFEKATAGQLTNAHFPPTESCSL